MNKFEKITAAVRSRNGSSGILTAAILAVVIVANVVLYVLAQTFGWYFMSTEKIDLSISGSTDALFADALEDIEAGSTEKVKINFCMAKSDLEKHDPGMYVHETALALQEKYPELIEVEYLNILRQVDSEGNPVDVKKYTKREGMDDAVILDTSVIFTYEKDGKENFKLVTDYVSADGFSSFFTLTSDLSVTSYNGEEVVASMVSWVLHDEHPTAYITVGHGETASSSLTMLLTCAGYNIDYVDLKTIDYTGEAKLLENPANMIIVSNPVTDFGQAATVSDVRDEIERLRTYVEGGGNLYVTFDPYVPKKNILNLTTLLEGYGITVSTSEVDGFTLRNIVRDATNSISADGYTLIAEFADGIEAQAYRDVIKDYGTAKVLIREAAALKVSSTDKAVAYPIIASPQARR